MKSIIIIIFVINLFRGQIDCAEIQKRQSHIVERRQNPTSKGPVLFPNNDATPAPRTPLIVTSRPLAEQINRSDQRGAIVVSKTPQNNPRTYWNQADNEIDNSGPYQLPYRGANPSQVYDYVIDPRNGKISLQDYGQLVRVANLPNLYSGSSKNSSVLDRHPYAAVAKKLKYLVDNNRGRGYNAYEQQTVLPPIYTALGNYAKTKVLKNNIASRPKAGKGSKKSNRKGDGDEDEYYNDNFANEAKQYAFSYSVKDQDTGDDFSHSQTNSGSATNGEYRVKLPDGRLQIVSYTADNGGYKAEVRYEGDAEEQQPIATPVEEPNDKLGRIVVPSREEAEYDDYYYEERLPKEVLITSRPGFIHTTPSTPTIVYDRLIYHNKGNIESGNYLSTPTPIVYVQDGRHFADASSPQDGRFYNGDVVSTTPAPVGVYDHLDTPDRNIKSGQVRYTTVAPLVYSISTPTYYLGNGEQRPTPSVDLRKYFDYKK